MSDEKQTRYSFGQKWRTSPNFQIGGLEAFDTDTLSWIITRNGFHSIDDFAAHLESFETILDAGCGNGRILGLLSSILRSKHNFVGIDLAAADVARSNFPDDVVTIVQGDILDSEALSLLPRPDFIYCQEVLHHTSDASRSFSNLVQILNDGGEIAIYVYKKKAPIREFTDDFVRGMIKDLDHEEALAHAAEFTALGRVLSELDIEFQSPAVSALGIPAGRYSVQRFLYHFFVKCYWNPNLSVEHNNMVNFDWYHPALCSRHTLPEVLMWFENNELSVVHSYVDEYGITVRGRKV
jgi:SAM-dependent methyltransferase